MISTKAQRQRNEGVALLMALGYLAAITLFASTFIVSLHRTMDQRNRSYWNQQCMGIAEGGLEKALAELRRSSGAYAGEEDTPLGAGTFSVAVRKDVRHGQYRIVSTGQLRHGARTFARVCIEAEAGLAADGSLREMRWVEVRVK